MHLRSYYFDLAPKERVALAESCDTTTGHLQNIAYDLRKASAALSVAIERATNKAVTRQDLRPDDWHLIWPELAKSKRKPSRPTKEAADV